MHRTFLGGLLLCLAAGSLHAQTVPSPAAPIVMPAAPTSAASFPSVMDGPIDGAGWGCGPGNGQFWISTEYLLWWIKSAPEGGPLVTTDPSNGATATAGGLADPTTQTVIGGSNFRYPAFSGARFQTGMAVSDGLAVEAGGFFLASQNRTRSAGSDATGNPFLFRPLVNVDTGNLNAGAVVASPGSIAGGIQVVSQSQLWGTNANLSAVLVNDETFRIDALAGFRYLNLQEQLEFRQASTVITDVPGVGSFGGVPTLPGDSFFSVDRFRTLNQFYGGQLGLRGQVLLGRVMLSGNARLSLGDTQQLITVTGNSTLLPASGSIGTSLPGGILALPSNSGSFVHNRFTVIPELGVQVGYTLTSCMRLGVGYDLLYWSSVVRPGNQVPQIVSASQIPTSPSFGTSPAAVPGPQAHNSDFWAQGLSFSLAFGF